MIFQIRIRDRIGVAGFRGGDHQPAQVKNRKIRKINKNFRRPEDLHPEEYQQQLEVLIHEYAQLQEHTTAIEKVNREGGQYIREAKVRRNEKQIEKSQIF